MKAIYQVSTPTSTTVNTLVADLYDVREPGTSAIDPERLDAVAAVLRKVNPTLPTDETSFGNTSLWLPRVPGIWFRIRPVVSPAVADTLEAASVYNARQIGHLTLDYLAGVLPSESTATRQDVRELALLLLLPGVGPQLALDLHSNGITSPRVVHETDQATLKTLLETFSLPAAFLALRPWWVLKRRARKLLDIPVRRIPRVARMPVLPAEARDQQLHWQDKAKTSKRSQAERTSASVSAWAYDLLEHYTAASRDLAAGRSQAASEHLLAIYRAYGDKAVEYGVTSAGSPDVSGPSMETILEVTWRLLDALSEHDVEDARARMRIARPRHRGVCAFTLDDLAPPHFDTLSNAFDNVQPSLGEMGEDSVRRLDEALSDRLDASLPTWLKTGVTTPNTGSRPRLYGREDREQVLQNARSGTFADLKADAALWTKARSTFALRDLRDVAGVGDALGPQTADAVLDPVVSQAVGAEVTQHMTAFERYFAWTRPETDDEVRVPINASFPERYRTLVLGPTLSDEEERNLLIPDEDFTDPATLLFAAPLLMSRAVPIMTAQAAAQMGNTHLSSALLAALPQAADTTSAMTNSLADQADRGSAADGYTCRGATALLGELRELNTRGETAYKEQRFVDATDHFQDVIRIAKACPWVTHYGLVDPIPLVLEGVTDLVGERPLWEPLGAVIVEDELVQPLFPFVDVQLPTVGPFDPTILTQVYNTQAVLVQDYLTIRFSTGRVVEFESADDYEDALDYMLDPQDSTFHITNRGGGVSTHVIDERSTIQAEVLRAALHLASLEAGLNWLGLPQSMIPVWSFQYLVDRALSMASRAEQLQQAALGLLQAADAKALDETRFLQAKEVAAAAVAIAAEEEALSRMAADEAQLRVEAAELALQQAKRASVFQVVGGAVAVAASVAVVALSGGSAAVVAAGVIGTASSALSSAQSVNETVGRASRHKKDFEIAESAREQANTAANIAAMRTGLAKLQSANADALLAQLQGQESSSENLIDLLSLFNETAKAQLRMATKMAWLAERAIWYQERRHPGLIAHAYDGDSFTDKFGGAARLRTALDALVLDRTLARQTPEQTLKATFRLTDLNARGLATLPQTRRVLIPIDQKALDLRFPGLYLHRLKRVEVELVGLLPAQGLTGVLRRAGESPARVPYDARYVPELYAADKVDASTIEDWPFPPSEWDYNRATPGLKPPFILAKPQLPQQVQVLSEYRRSADGGVLTVEPGALDTLENSPPAGTWLLEFPASANPTDLARLADVRVTLYFSAHYSEALKDAQEARLTSDTAESTAAVEYSIRKSASGAALEDFLAFRAPPGDTSLRDVRTLALTLDDVDVPAGLARRTLQNFLLSLVGLEGTALTARVRASAFPFGARQDSTVDVDRFPDGLFVSNVGRGAIQFEDESSPVQPSVEDTQEAMDALVTSTSPTDPAGTTWSLKVLPEDNPGFLLLDDDGEPVEVTAGALELGAGSATFDGGDWAFAETTVRLAPALGAFTLTHREGTAAVNLRVERLLGLEGRLRLQAWTGASEPTFVEGTDQRTSPDGELDSLYVVGLRVTKTAIEVLLDGMVMLTLGAPPAGSGSIHLAFDSTGPCHVSGVEVQRLRHDGTALEKVVDERFADADAWTLSGTAAAVSQTHNLLDLSFAKDALLVLDLTASLQASA